MRLHVITAGSTGPFSQLVQRWPIPAPSEIDMAHLALMNGVNPGDTIQEGTKLKVLVQAR